MAVRTLFLLDVLRDLSERREGQARDFFGRQGLPAVSGSPSCPRLQVPAPGLMRIACTDGEDRFGAERPATGSNLENPVRRPSAPGGGGRISAALSCRRLLSARSGWRVATGGSRMCTRAANWKELAVDRAAKKELVTALNGVFKGTSVVVVAHYSGLNVAQMQTLRRQMKQAG